MTIAARSRRLSIVAMGVVASSLAPPLASRAVADGPGGACCVQEGCVPVANEGECIGMGGYFVAGADCASNPCGVGACCTEFQCVETDAYTCFLGGRTFVGAGTSCDVGDPCGIGVGACCHDGECSISKMADCTDTGGTFAGIGTVCGTDPCTAGACCVGVECFEEARFECADRGGTFLAGAVCADDPCADPKGCPTDALFSQGRDGPLGFTAMTSEFSANFERWENFSGVAGAIEGLLWWGLDLDNVGPNQFVECEEEDPTFLVTFHEDAGGRPGAAVCTDKVTATRTATGIIYNGAELNEYTATLTSPCVLVNGWVSIVGLGDPECWFLWMSAGPGTSWCDRCIPSEQSLDLSLCLFGTPGGVFGACCNDDTGSCADGVEITDCLGPNERFRPDAACGDLDPPCGVILGACCFGDATCSVLVEVDCGAAGGEWLGSNTICEACPCVAVCPDGSRAEGEPRCEDDYVDVFNGGCFSTQPAFTPIAPGDVVCGESGLFSLNGETTPDYDVYELVNDEAGLIEWEVVAEFPVRLRIINGTEGCPGQEVLTSAGFECETVIIAAFIQPGTYWLTVEPALFTDSASCGARYTARLSPDPCPADLDGSGSVDFGDILAVLAAWGPCPPQFCPRDLDASGAVDFADLLVILGAWGPCPPAV